MVCHRTAYLFRQRVWLGSQCCGRFSGALGDWLRRHSRIRAQNHRQQIGASTSRASRYWLGIGTVFGHGADCLRCADTVAPRSGDHRRTHAVWCGICGELFTAFIPDCQLRQR
ncbi:Uncharacterised protein [Vibrio cholerae]|nr:Uncharacterised protein [Vibrio cholerae]